MGFITLTVMLRAESTYTLWYYPLQKYEFYLQVNAVKVCEQVEKELTKANFACE